MVTPPAWGRKKQHQMHQNEESVYINIISVNEAPIIHMIPEMSANDSHFCVVSETVIHMHWIKSHTKRNKIHTCSTLSLGERLIYLTTISSTLTIKPRLSVQLKIANQTTKHYIFAKLHHVHHCVPICLSKHAPEYRH